MKQKSKAALIFSLACLAPWRQTHSLLKECFNQLWLILTFVILFFFPPAEVNLPFIWSNHSRNINTFQEKVYFTDPVPCCLLVFSNSIFEFTFFVLSGCEKLCSAWSPPLQILQLHPWAWWWHHGGKTPTSFSNTCVIQWRLPRGFVRHKSRTSDLANCASASSLVEVWKCLPHGYLWVSHLWWVTVYSLSAQLVYLCFLCAKYNISVAKEKLQKSSLSQSEDYQTLEKSAVTEY